MATSISALVETLILFGCSRCGRRLIDAGHRLPCVVDALDSTPTAVHCIACADIVEAGRLGEEAALVGLVAGDFVFGSEAERQEFEAEYRKTLAILERAK